MNVSVVIAAKDDGVEDCPHRRASFAWVYGYWRETLPDAEFVVSGAEPFTRARALNDAVRRSSGDVILHSDPDSFVDARQALEALRLASEDDGLVVAFDRYLYLSESATAEFYASGLVRPDADSTEGAGGVGNCTAYSRATWERAGGYDERFGIWGADDGCFAYAAAALVAPTRRVEGPVVHLWHPRRPESFPGGPGYAEQFAIVAEYRDAADDPAAIRDILARREGAARL